MGATEEDNQPIWRDGDRYLMVPHLTHEIVICPFLRSRGNKTWRSQIRRRSWERWTVPFITTGREMWIRRENSSAVGGLSNVSIWPPFRSWRGKGNQWTMNVLKDIYLYIHPISNELVCVLVFGVPSWTSFDGTTYHISIRDAWAPRCWQLTILWAMTNEDTQLPNLEQRSPRWVLRKHPQTSGPRHT